MKFQTLLLLAIFAAQLSACVAPGGVARIVRDPSALPARAAVDGGVLEGAATPAGKVWLGIAYAQPPVGALRWRAPRPPARWGGIRQSRRLGGDCVQNLSPGSLLGKPGGLFVRGTEDCLFLNVYTPSNAQAGQGWPVMVWLHGGGFAAGTAGNYDPSVLAQKQGVIVVTLNYRLGAFGFLAHPALSQEDADAGSGNYGLLDQQAALRWVRGNISAFGGDPRRITLFGESAGGFSVCHQLASPDAAGLFAGAIIESGACTGLAQNTVLSEAEAAGLITARDLGCGAAEAALCMRAAPAGAIARLVSHRRGALGPNSWGAVVQTPVLPLTMREAFSEGRFTRTPVILGVNHDEGRLFAYLQRLAGHLWSRAGYQAILRATYGPSASAVWARYPSSAYSSPALAYAAIVTDESFVCPALETAGLLASRGHAWVYEFDDARAPTTLPRLPGMPQLGAYHASEIAFVLQRPWILADPDRFTPAERVLSENIQGAWGQFARTGDPAGDAGSPWPPYPEVRLFSPASQVKASTMASDHNCEFWRMQIDAHKP